MSSFAERTIVRASRQEVWLALADIGEIAAWNPGLLASRRTNDIDGVGGTRHCEISSKHSLTEQVVRFEPQTAITFRITDSTMPFKTADVRFTLDDSLDPHGTVVTVSPDYTLEYGTLGRILDAAAVRRSYRKGMRELLAGLKQHLEQGSSSSPPPPRRP